MVVYQGISSEKVPVLGTAGLETFMNESDTWTSGVWDENVLVFRNDRISKSKVSPKVLNKPQNTMALNFAHYFSEN